MSDVHPDRQPPRAVKWTILLGATALVLYLCLLILRPFFGVIAWSSVLAIAFYPVHRRLVRRTGRPSLSAFLSSLLVVVVIVLPLAFVVGLAANQFLTLREYVQETFKGGLDLSVVEPLRGLFDWLTARLRLDGGQLVGWLTQYASQLGRAGGGFAFTVAANVSSSVVSFVFTMFAMFFLFRDGARIAARIPDLLPFDRARSVAMLDRVRDVIYASVYGVLVIAGLQGTLCALMFWILGIPSAVLWGVATVLTGVLPLVGSAAVWVPGTIYLAVTGRWPQAIVLGVWGTVVISGVDNFLRPRLVGGRVGLSELVMFFALLGGMQVFGLLGIVLGPILFAVAGSIFDVLSDGHESAPSGP